MRRLLTPLCWLRTGFAGTIPISGHTYREVKWEKRGDKYHHVLRCVTCGRTDDKTWHENPVEAGLVSQRELEEATNEPI